MSPTDNYDHASAEDQGDNARQLAAEVIARVFQWAADAKTLDELGYRSLIALACVRPDFFDDATLEDVGFRAGRPKQAIWKLQQDFRQVTGL